MDGEKPSSMDLKVLWRFAVGLLGWGWSLSPGFWPSSDSRLVEFKLGSSLVASIVLIFGLPGDLPLSKFWSRLLAGSCLLLTFIFFIVCPNNFDCVFEY